MILIDTSAFIEFLNCTGSALDTEIERLITRKEDVALSDIILMEILQGIENDKEYKQIESSLQAFPIYSLKNTGSYIAAADLYRRCRKRGITIRSTIYLLVAQVALENNLTLFHNDKDFNDIAEVCVLNFYKMPC